MLNFDCLFLGNANNKNMVENIDGVSLIVYQYYCQDE
jgi:hypothetical protein